MMEEAVTGTRAGGEFYRRGCLKIDRERIQYTQQDFFDEIAKKKEWFHEDPKDKGTYVLDFNQVGGDGDLQRRFVDVLFDSGLVQAAYRALQRPFYLTNFMHMVTPPGAPALGWHRDTYFQKDGAQVGLVPPPVKLTLLHGPVENKSAAFECLPGSQRIDFQSRWFDRVFRVLAKPWHFSFVGKAGDAMLFETSILHRRRAAKPGLPRSATIFSFAGAKRHLGNYYPRHHHEINHFIKRLEASKLFDISGFDPANP